MQFYKNGGGRSLRLRLHSSFRPNNERPRQIGERQTEGDARHEAERFGPSHYDDDGQNIGDENISVELHGARHNAGGLSPMGLDCNPTPERAPDLFSAEIHSARR
jgi:hypothetical protein